MNKSILVVCSGNINRSPAAQLMLMAWTGQWHKIQSCGLGAGAKHGFQMTKPMKKAMAEAGYETPAHFSTHISKFDLSAFDYILTMGSGQKKKVEAMGVPESKVKSLGGYIGLGSIPDPQFTRDFSGVVAILEKSLKVFLREELGIEVKGQS